MADLLQLIITTGPSTLLIIVGLVWGKKIIDYYYASTIELRKTKLNQDFESFKKELEIENKKLQNQLDTKLSDFNIRFSKLHQERAEVIKTVYLKLIELQSAMFSFTRTIQPIIEDAETEREQRLERINRALQDFINYYFPNRLFFSPELAKKIEHLKNEYYEKGWDFAFFDKQFHEAKLQHNTFLEYHEKSKEISKSVKDEFPKLIEEVENEFRKILGVE